MRKDAAIGLVFNEDKSQILLVKRRDVPVWVLPGGGVENGESFAEAVTREVFEETGLKVEVVRKIALYTPINSLARLTETYECRVVDGSLQVSHETKEIQFFPSKQLPKNFFFLHEEWLKDALKNSHRPIERPLTNVTYWNLAKYFVKHPFWVMRFLSTLLCKN
jgi:8-oxo-dGTP diphosphatase